MGVINSQCIFCSDGSSPKKLSPGWSWVLKVELMPSPSLDGPQLFTPINSNFLGSLKKSSPSPKKNGQAREKPEPGLGSDQSLIFCEYLWVIDKKIGSICWHQSARGRTDRIVSRSVDLVYPAKGNGKNSRKQIETSASAMHCKSEQWTHTSSVLILQSVAKKNSLKLLGDSLVLWAI